MTELRLTLSEEQARTLASEAERSNVSLEQIALRKLFEPSEAVDSTFERALDYVTTKNAELMGRLA